ncbi:MAG: alpha/beta fold hydrolase [Chloroflexi bacterium]|uniref:alpha/beta hydrolase n=1 Tax=Candidatus Flexifilum breve TaxID=3140694 RepID=UPI003137693D|nr:alpha/beta fold hydrolase [Chloroflexota bacterium]
MKRLIVITLALLLALPFGVFAQEATEEPTVAQAQTVLDRLINGDFAGIYEQFSPEVQAALTAEQLEGAWGDLVQQVGDFQGLIATDYAADSNTAILHLNFELIPLDLLVTYNADNQISGLRFAQSSLQPTAVPTFSDPPYADTAVFSETEVMINADGAYPLPGTLSMPAADGLVPAVLLLSGSGPNDRDETLYSNKPFRDLAWGLATQGIAVLRFDKRTLIHGAGSDPTALTIDFEYTEDALAALELLRGTEGIDPERIYVAGHSLGGYILPRIAAQAANIAGLIYLAPLARPIQDAIVDQTRYLAELDGTVSAADQQAIDAMQALSDQINALTEEDADDDTLLFGAMPIYYLDLQGYDPVATAADLDLPMLFIQGERDYQVTVADELVLWQAGLESRDDVTFATFPTLNHLLFPGDGAPSPQEYQTPGHVDGGVINTIADGIEAQ